nr:glycosyltransferase family 4 protein [Desulfobacula sp.]
MNLIIIGETIGFPIGLAATARVRCLAKALKREGHHITILNTIGLSEAYTTARAKTSGVCQEIPYLFCGGYSVRPSTKIQRLVEMAIGYARSLFIIVTLKITGKLDCVLLYSRSRLMVRYFGVLCRMLKLPFVIELCEWPEAIGATRGDHGPKPKQYSRAVAKNATAVIPISHYIADQVKQLSQNKPIPFQIIPILFDSDPLPGKGTDKYILYTGSADYGDIWRIVLDSLALLHERGLVLEMVMTCSGKPAAVENLRQYITRKNLGNQVRHLGYVDDDAFQDLINSAAVLIAPLPDNLQSIARFPTKLAFFLASGRPVVTSDVGEIRYYLTDGKNAFVTSSGCRPTEFAEKISTIMINGENAEKIGLQGRKTAFENFYYKSQSRCLSDFLENTVSAFKKSAR